MGRFSGNHLRWPIERTGRTFTVRVVEPRVYEPALHGAIFNAVLTELVAPSSPRIDPYTDPRHAFSAIEEFDLVTFPEAFLGATDLLEVLSRVKSIGSLGCVHVGLRPAAHDELHLFTVDQIQKLADQLSAISSLVMQDIASFQKWLGKQKTWQRFNLGCLFTIDASGELRVCLHPKLVRSKFESHAMPEEHMEEADLLTLVTLSPTDKEYLSVTLQPLICSDVLNISRDRPGDPPLKAVNTDAICFEDPPDHIDVVSVATCTPQPSEPMPYGQSYLTWHGQFLEAFKTTQSGLLPRHNFSTIVLANFLFTPPNKRAGLSGIFMPVPPGREPFHQDVSVCCWGRSRTADHGDNHWSTPTDNAQNEWSNKGFIAALKPTSEEVTVRLFGFTISRLPRDVPRWDTPGSLTRCWVHVGIPTADGVITFQRNS